MKASRNIVQHNNLYPREVTVYSSKIQAFVLFAVVCGICYLPAERLLLDASNDKGKDQVMLAVLIVAALYFLFRTIYPRVKFSLSPDALWTKKSGFQKWSAIDDIFIKNEKSINQHGHENNKTYFVFLFNERSGLDENVREVKYAVNSLNKNKAELEQMAGTFKRLYFEKHNVEIGNQVFQPIKKSLIKKENASGEFFSMGLMCSLLALAAGTFLLYKSMKRQDDYDSVKGRISYINSSFHEFHDLDTKFIQLEGDPIVYQLFTGKGKYDFSPEVDETNSLKTGDTISIYGGDAEKEIFKTWYFNKKTAFIEKHGKVVYSDNKTVGSNLGKILLILSLTGVIVSSLIYFRKRREGIEKNRMTS